VPLLGIIIGDLIGRAVGMTTNVGGVGIAMLLLIISRRGGEQSGAGSVPSRCCLARCCRSSSSSEPELPLILQRGEADVFVEVVGEAALVVEAEVGGDLADLRVFVLEGLARGLDAELHDEGLRAAAEGLDEFAVKLAWAEVDLLSEILHAEAGAEVLADVGEGSLDVLAGVNDGHGLAVALGDAHDADETAFFVPKRHFVRDEPVGDALLIEEELDDVELGLSGAEDLFVVTAEVFGEPAWEDIEVVFVHELVFTLEAHGLDEVAVGADEAEVAVFGEKGDAWKGVKHPVRLALEIERAQEFGAQLGSISGFHVRSLTQVPQFAPLRKKFPQGGIPLAASFSYAALATVRCSEERAIAAAWLAAILLRVPPPPSQDYRRHLLRLLVVV
jgi:hypothetical protein